VVVVGCYLVQSLSVCSVHCVFPEVEQFPVAESRSHSALLSLFSRFLSVVPEQIHSDEVVEYILIIIANQISRVIQVLLNYDWFIDALKVSIIECYVISAIDIRCVEPENTKGVPVTIETLNN